VPAAVNPLSALRAVDRARVGQRHPQARGSSAGWCPWFAAQDPGAGEVDEPGEVDVDQHQNIAARMLATSASCRAIFPLTRSRGRQTAQSRLPW
jgi:hypothetical protein